MGRGGFDNNNSYNNNSNELGLERTYSSTRSDGFCYSFVAILIVKLVVVLEYVFIYYYEKTFL